MDYEPIAEVFRGQNRKGLLIDPQLESQHFGVVVAVDEENRVLLSRGNIHLKTFVRSAAKPFQILPLLASGGIEYFDLTSKESAVICASHNGEPVHVAAVAGILKKIGLNESHLQCGPHPPMHAPSAERLLRSDEPVTALHNNCSGKHAGMLAGCVKNGYSVDDYLDFEHPLQLKIYRYVKQYSGTEDVFRGTDGCSAPVFRMEVLEMARMFARLAAGKDPLLQRSFSILRTEPYMIGGDKRFDTDLMLNSNVVAKVGGEGIQCVGVPPSGKHSAIGIAMKVADGNFRALYPVTVAILQKLGALNHLQMEKLSYFSKTPLKNHRKLEIGFIRSVAF